MKTNIHFHAIEVLERRIAPATFLVTVLTDGSGDGTLRKAITDANAASGADVIEFKSGGKIKLDSALPDITDDVTISAKKAITLDGQNAHGIIAISGAGVDVVLDNLKLTNGRAETGAALKIDSAGGTVLFKKGVISGNRAVGMAADAEGGGIALLNGALTIENSVISGNVADTTTRQDDGYGHFENVGTGAGKGGGIFVKTGTVLISNTTISGNRAVGRGGEGHGGGIAIEAGTLTITDSKLMGNLSEGVDNGGFGGAISAKGGAVSLDKLHLLQNTAKGPEGSGGGVFVGGAGSLTATESTFSKNTAQGANGINGAKGANGTRGARASDPGGDGEPGGAGEAGTAGTDAGFGLGGAICSAGSVTLTDSEVTGNSALGGKGGTGGNGGKGGAGGAGGRSSRYCYDGYCETTPAGHRGEGGEGGEGGAAGVGGTAAGGAIFNGASGTVTLHNTTIGGNLAKAGAHGKAGKGGAGGGGGASKGANGAPAGGGEPLVLTAFGGGIQNFGTATIGDGSVLIANVAAGATAAGGGISNGSATAILNVSDATISGNKVFAANGVNGGKGAKGANGFRGEPGGDGEPGEEGSPGGDGAAGGNALGGGIYNLGTATIEDTTISGNTVAAGKGGNGGAGGAGGSGGAGGRSVRYNDGYETTVTPAGHRGEGASGAAGGAAGAAGRGAGGGIYNAATNTAAEGDPVVLAGGSLTIKDTTISGNSTKTGTAGKAGKGGARGAGGTSATAGAAGTDAPASESGGGGVFSENGTLDIVQATIAKNTAGGSGGGVKIIGSDSVAKIANSTIAENFASGLGGGLFVGLDTVEVISTIIAKNIIRPTSPTGANVSGIIVSSFSLIDVDPLLGKLALNGGTTATMLPLAGSPALNAGSNPNALTTDQRGLTRVVGAAIDIGAVEVAA